MKIITTLISSLFISGLLVAQHSPINRNLKSIQNPILFSNADVAHQQSSNKATQSQWVDYATAYAGNYGSTPYGIIGNFLFPDTTILVNYGSGGYSGPWIHSVSQTFDLKAMAYPNTGIGINGSANFTIDSIEILGTYFRPDNNVVDTLIVNVVNVGANLSGISYFEGGTINTNLNSDTVFMRDLDWNYPTKKVASPKSTYKIPLTQAFFAATNAQGLHVAKVSAGDLILGAANGVFAITLDFKPGYTWNANLDTLGVNKNGWLFGAYELNGNGTYPNYNKKDLNVSSLVTDVVRYNNAGGWNGSYIPSYAYMGATPGFQYEAMAIAVKLTQHTSVTIPDCSKPFFSEYIEGSSSNKALEIYNPTGSTINLSNYQIRRYNNGSSTPVTTTLAGTVLSNSVFVIANTASAQGILDVTNMTNNTIAIFNGNDALELYDMISGTVVDVIGVVGVDPGISWPVGTGSTVDRTLVRMAGIKAGTDVWTGVGDQQWNVYANNDFSYLGTHVNNGCFTAQTPLVAIPTISADTICAGETIQFSNASTGGTAPYTVAWNLGNGNTSTNSSTSFTYATLGVYQISLTVTDNLGATDDSVFYVVVNGLPNTGMSIQNLACSGKEVIINPTNFNAANNYVYTEGSTVLNHTNGLVRYTNANPGTYSITQTVTSPSGCAAVATQTIVVNQSPVANFTSTGGGPTINFTDASTNAVSWNWSFGDGNSSSIKNPANTYTATGNYNVSLTVLASNGCADTLTNSVAVGTPSAVNETSKVGITMYPNPIKDGTLTIKTTEEVTEITVLNVLGQNIITQTDATKTIAISDLVSGTYFVKVTTTNGTIIQKLIKE